MNYFYVNAARQATGPLDAPALAALRRKGEVRDDTPVAREGDPAWGTYAGFFGGARPPAVASAARPAAVQVFGWLNIVFGVFGLFCCPFALFGEGMSAFGAHEAGNSVLAGWTLFSAVFGVFLNLALLASGAGLLRYRKWGHSLALAVCLLQVARTAAATALQWTALGSGSWEDETHLLAAVAIGAAAVAGLVYPFVMFVVLRLPAVREAFDGPEPEP